MPALHPSPLQIPLLDAYAGERLEREIVSSPAATDPPAFLREPYAREDRLARLKRAVADHARRGRKIARWGGVFVAMDFTRVYRPRRKACARKRGDYEERAICKS